MRRVREKINKRLKAGIAAAGFLLSTFALLAQPANDVFAKAQVISGRQGESGGEFRSVRRQQDVKEKRRRAAVVQGAGRIGR